MGKWWSVGPSSTWANHTATTGNSHKSQYWWLAIYPLSGPFYLLRALQLAKTWSFRALKAYVSTSRFLKTSTFHHYLLSLLPMLILMLLWIDAYILIRYWSTTTMSPRTHTTCQTSSQLCDYLLYTYTRSSSKTSVVRKVQTSLVVPIRSQQRGQTGMFEQDMMLVGGGIVSIRRKRWCNLVPHWWPCYALNKWRQ